MIYNTAYDTTACQGFRMGPIVDAVTEANLREYVHAVDSCLLVQSMRGASSAIPAFNHPLYIGKKDAAHLMPNGDWKQGNFLAIDLRACGSWNEDTNEFTVKNSMLYKTKLWRAALTGIWLEQGPESVRNMTGMACSVFASWISESISRRYGLDAKTQYDLMILSGLFYMSNHVNGMEFESAKENRYLSSIATSLRVQLKDVIDLYDRVKLIHSVDDFCKKASTELGNIRLSELNAGVLTLIMKNTWYGDNNAESILVAMEHPPTWLSILLESYTNTAMRKTAIFKLTDQRQYKDGLEMLVRAVKSMAPQTAALTAQCK
jgi:hypothetical protein